MKKITIRSLSILILTAVVLNTASIPVQAAKTVSVDATNKAKKAPELKTGKTYVVTQKANYYYVKFTAEKKGTYKITISDIKTTKASKPDHQLGIFYVRGYSKSATADNRPSSLKVKTQGGETSSLFMATPASYKDYVKKALKDKKATTTTDLSSRYAQLKLTKGQTILLDYYHTGNKGKCSYTITIEKKK